MPTRRGRVYVAGPYTQGDPIANVARAIRAGNTLRDLGFAPFIPHLTAFWHMLCQREYEDWLEYDNEWLKFCHCVLRLPGPSNGADKEVELAKSLGLKVYNSIEDLSSW